MHSTSRIRPSSFIRALVATVCALTACTAQLDENGVTKLNDSSEQFEVSLEYIDIACEPNVHCRPTVELYAQPWEAVNPPRQSTGSCDSRSPANSSGPCSAGGLPITRELGDEISLGVSPASTSWTSSPWHIGRYRRYDWNPFVFGPLDAKYFDDSRYVLSVRFRNVHQNRIDGRGREMSTAPISPRTDEPNVWGTLDRHRLLVGSTSNRPVTVVNPCRAGVKLDVGGATETVVGEGETEISVRNGDSVAVTDTGHNWTIQESTTELQIPERLCPVRVVLDSFRYAAPLEEATSNLNLGAGVVYGDPLVNSTDTTEMTAQSLESNSEQSRDFTPFRHWSDSRPNQKPIWFVSNQIHRINFHFSDSDENWCNATVQLFETHLAGEVFDVECSGVAAFQFHLERRTRAQVEAEQQVTEQAVGQDP